MEDAGPEDDDDWPDADDDGWHPAVKGYPAVKDYPEVKDGDASKFDVRRSEKENMRGSKKKKKKGLSTRR